MNGLKTYQSLMGKLNYALFLAVMVVLPLPRMIVQPIAVAWVISWVLEGRFLQRERWRWNKMAWPGLLLVLLTVWEAVSLLWCPSVHDGLKVIDRHWPLVVLMLVPIFGLNEHYHADKMLRTLFAACVASVGIYLFTSYWVSNYEAVLWFRHDLIKPFEFPEMHGITSLMKLRSFYCLVLTLSMCSTPLLYGYYVQRYPRWEVILTLGVGNLVMLAGMLMTGSRSAVLFLAATAAFLIFVTYRKQWKWWVQMLVVLTGFAVGVGAVVLNPRFYTFLNVDMHHIVLSEFTDMKEPRFYIWATILRHLQDFPLYGLGAGQHINFLLDQYREAGNQLLVDMAYGPHCQYLGMWICLGPLAAVLLLGAFFVIPKVFKGAGHYSAHALAFLFALNMLTDDFLERMDSVLTLIVWFVLVYMIETTKTEKP